MSILTASFKTKSNLLINYLLKTPNVNVTSRAHPAGGIHITGIFSSGYGYSIIYTDFSYGSAQGLWELAVFRNNSLCYDTPITYDVLGHLTEKSVQCIVHHISKFTSRPCNPHERKLRRNKYIGAYND